MEFINKLFSFPVSPLECKTFYSNTTPSICGWSGYYLSEPKPSLLFIKIDTVLIQVDSSKSTALILFKEIINIDRLDFDKRQLHRYHIMQFYFMKIQIFTETSVDIIPYKSNLIVPTDLREIFQKCAYENNKSEQ